MSHEVLKQGAEAPKAVEKTGQGKREIAKRIAPPAVGALALGAVAFVWPNVAEHILSPIIVAVGTGVIAYFTAALFDATSKMQQATTATLNHLHREFEAEHRPWIAVEVEPYRALTFAPDQDGFVYLHFAFRNEGSVPAVRVWMDYVLVPPFLDAVEEQQKLVKAMERAAEDPDSPSISVFPGGNPVTLNRPYHIPRSLVDDWCAWWDENGENGYRWSYKTHIAGCVLYKSPLDNQLRHTGFIRELHEAEFNLSGEVNALIPINPNQKRLIADQMRTTGSVLGGGAID